MVPGEIEPVPTDDDVPVVPHVLAEPPIAPVAQVAVAYVIVVLRPLLIIEYMNTEINTNININKTFLPAEHAGHINGRVKLEACASMVKPEAKKGYILMNQQGVKWRLCGKGTPSLHGC